ncbi:MAG: hypothetical protein U0998_04030 [Moraxellaceae bacterium]|nr:hypothetical protein [Moraxellaceae bacterium]MDZ4386375.1 hypothetical protein [Moraxellaceae bacterium]
MNKLNVSAIALAAAVGLAACGGGGSKSNNAPVDTAPSTETLTFEGSFIDGANYVSSARSGVTGLDCEDVKPGCFDVLSAGDTVTFTLGSIELPPITTAAGVTRVTTLDIARAIDPEADPDSLAFKAVYAVLAALDAEPAAMVGGVKVFKVKPAAGDAEAQSLKEIVEAANDESELTDALANAITESTGQDFAADDVDLTAGDDSEIAAEFNAGFEGGLLPVGFFDDDTPADFAARLSLTTADLLGRWTVSYEEDDIVEVSGAFFKASGLFDTAETLAGSGFASFSPDAKWNVVNRVFTVKIDDEDEGADCYLTERNENSSVLTFACREVDEDTDTVVDTELTLTKADDLLTVLTAGDGTWNEVFEARFYDEGEEPGSTVTFGPGNTITVSEGEGDEETGTFSLNGLMLLVDVDGDEFTCYFAGRQAATAPNTIDGVFFRCFENLDAVGEDLLLTKESGMAPLENTF